MPVGIIGGRGCGKSVFISLLATSAIKYANSPDGKDFRYRTDPAFTDAIGKIIASLKRKAWPSANLKGNLSEYKLTFGYHRRFAGKADEAVQLATLRRSRLTAKQTYNIVHFSLYDVAGEDVEAIKRVAESARKRQIVLIEEIPKDLRTILDCNVLVFLIDASKMTTNPEDPRFDEMLEYDNLMADLMSLVAVYKSRPGAMQQHEKLYPVFVLTKFDDMDAEVARAVGIPQDYATWLRFLRQKSKRVMPFVDKGKEERSELARRFMNTFMEHTLAQKTGAWLAGVDMDKSFFSFSYIATELSKVPGQENMEVPKLLIHGREGAVDLDYSETEYRGFIDYFGKISRDIRDEDEVARHLEAEFGR